MDIRHDVVVDAPPERILSAITTQAGIAGWWTPDTTAEARVGSINSHGFGELGTLRMRVDVLDTDCVVWSAIDGVPIEWKAAKITLSVASRDGGTTVQFQQGPFPDDYDHLGKFNYLWGQYMRSLKLYAETGIGEPYGTEESKKARTTPA